MIEVTSDKITEYLGANPFSFEIFNVIDSTNVYAKNTVFEKSANRVIIADKQINGRGRCGRDFYSPADNGIYMSVVIKADKTYSDLELLTIGVASVVHYAIEKVAGCKCEIKWVNDIFLNEKKICGILCENLLESNTGKIKYVIIGIGINVKTTENFPPELHSVAGALSMEMLDRNLLIAEILKGIMKISEEFNFEKYLSYYKANSMVLNKTINYTKNGKLFSGKAIGINASGNLEVELADKTIDVLKSGEIRIGKENVKD